MPLPDLFTLVHSPSSFGHYFSILRSLLIHFSATPLSVFFTVVHSPSRFGHFSSIPRSLLIHFSATPLSVFFTLVHSSFAIRSLLFHSKFIAHSFIRPGLFQCFSLSYIPPSRFGHFSLIPCSLLIIPHHPLQFFSPLHSSFILRSLLHH